MEEWNERRRMKEFAEREKERTEDRKNRREGPEEEGGGVGRARGGPRGRGRRGISPRLRSVPSFILRARASAVFMAVI